MPLKFVDVQKDAKAFELLKAYMVKKMCVENYDFLLSRDSNEKLYTKFISPKSATQVNLNAQTQKGLDTLAAQKKFKEMDTLMKAAKTEVMNMTDADVCRPFEITEEYKNYLASKAPKAPPPVPPKPAVAKAPPPVPPKPATPAKPVVDLTAAKSAVAAMEKDLADGATFLTTATNTVKSKGKPADKEEVNRMFESGRMRHDKVHNAHTALLQKDKAFTRENFGAFFTKKDAFSKLWADYRKLLGK
ncbi:MAG TPA: hypothetical protein VHM90_07425 [Phycisphaerae bacterium]|nr:hypothetical protein [Phycisphaerae bacterium]